MCLTCTFVEFERLYISSIDLTLAERFLREYLGRSLHNSEGSRDAVLGEALTVTIIVTYARPFTQKYDRFGKRESFDTSFLVDPLPNQQRDLHDRIVRERHQVFAHSDAGPQRVRVIDTSDDRLIISHGIPVLLEKWEAEGLLANICQMKALLEPPLEQRRAVIGPYEFATETSGQAQKSRRSRQRKKQ